VLLVCTFYTPHVQNLSFQRTQTERIDQRLIDVWPHENEVSREKFEKLRRTYRKALYSKHYHIADDDLAWLGSGVEELGRLVELVCSERLAQLECATTAA
jgi:hypothetical protein